MAAIDLDRIRDQGKQFVDGFTPGQKAMTILGVIAVVLASMAFSHWSSSTNYAPLYTSLSGADAGKVTQALDSAGVKWKLADGGATVLVPAPVVYKERVALSAQGLPASSDDLSLLDKEGITASEFVQRVDYQRAMQGELEKTIEAIDGVASATVNLTIPPDQVFAGATDRRAERGGARAADRGHDALDRRGAGNRAPGRVEHPQHDARLRDRGRLQRQRAQRAGHGPVERSGPRAADVVRHRARHRRVDVPGDRARAEPRRRARAVGHELRPAEDDQRDEQHAGRRGKPIPAQQNTSTENFKGPSSAAAGVLGVNGTPAGAASGNEVYSKTTNQNTNALNQVETEVQQAPRKINRLSVAVLLDSSVVKPADVANWTKQIQAAVGYNAKRGDIVQVTPVPFSKAAQQAAKQQLKAASGSGSSSMVDLARNIVTLLIIALVLFFAWRAIKRAEANRVPLRVPLDLRELEAADTRGTGVGRRDAPAHVRRAPSARTGRRHRRRGRAHRPDRTPAGRSGPNAALLAR